MNDDDAKLLTELTAAFSTVITETTRAIARNSGGSISRHLIALDIQNKSNNLPASYKTAKIILNNITAELDDKPFNPMVIQATDT